MSFHGWIPGGVEVDFMGLWDEIRQGNVEWELE